MATKRFLYRAMLVTAVLTVGLAARSTGAQDSDSAELLFEEAIHKEVADGDLEGAIELYKQVLDRFPDNRAVAAKALFQMAQSYEKLGDPFAQEVYERVLRDYADQPEQVSAAQAWLATLTPVPTDTGSRGIIAALVREGPGEALLADGHALVYTDWTTGDLAMHDLETGETRRLTQKGTWAESNEYAMFPIPSPDGQYVAYTWSNESNGGWDLRIVGIDGSEPRVLYRTANYAEPKDWSTDGTQILALVARGDGTAQIVLVSVADGAVEVLKSLDWRWPRQMSLSPDGRWVVYDFPPLEDAPERDLFLLATDGSREVALVEHPADDHNAIWTPDGKTVLFNSDRSGSPALWALDVGDERATGPARLISNTAGESLGITSSGAYFFLQQAGQVSVYQAVLEPAADRVTASPEKLPQRVERASNLPAWSPDGRFLAYIREVQFRAPPVAVVRSSETGAQRTFPLNMTQVWRLGWFPDGHSLLLAGWDRGSNAGISRLDLETGRTTLLLRRYIIDAGVLEPLPVVSPDGNTVFYTENLSSTSTAQNRRLEQNRLLVHDLNSGESVEIYRPETPDVLISGLALSPNGRELAFSTIDAETFSTSVKVMSVGGGEVRELHAVPGDLVADVPFGSGAALIAWSPDGRNLFVETPLRSGGAPDQELWRLSLEGGAPVRVDLEVDLPVREHSVHPDGRQVAFAAGDQFAVEVWVLENLLAELEASSSQ